MPHIYNPWSSRTGAVENRGSICSISGLFSPIGIDPLSYPHWSVGKLWYFELGVLPEENIADTSSRLRSRTRVEYRTSGNMDDGE